MNIEEFEANFDMEALQQLCDAVPGAFIKKRYAMPIPFGDPPHVSMGLEDKHKYRNVIKLNSGGFDLWIADHTMVLHDATFEQAVMFLNDVSIKKIILLEEQRQ
jgi:hypothetical protein